MEVKIITESLICDHGDYDLVPAGTHIPIRVCGRRNEEKGGIYEDKEAKDVKDVNSINLTMD